MTDTDPALADPTTDAPARVLIVEDDPGMRVLLVRALHGEGIEALGARDEKEAWPLLDAGGIDLVMLDVMLPGRSGLDLIGDIRARHPGIPIIMVSALGGEADRIAGLDRGADDYVAKPFSRGELLARVRAALRRARTPVVTTASRGDIARFAGWTLDLRRRTLLAPDGAAVELSGAEHDLLAILVQQPHRIIGRERLLELSRARRAQASDRSIDVLVSRLRRKLGDVDNGEDLIRTVRGRGYMLAADVERS
ncbi:DNA-binding response regulator, OmpR family, contains REC and winged-helix (wHTH) domain [Sphingomonas laterariae]|uniref:Regulatory protein VirG n=1 Tax=Edaphosphingomonas laterariae TaxID=861865 RepID=A0A239GZ13_9SPHN|nr:response regulator transcription factor [Sphingomonas laterariae]SNS73264.1 DNA-binding response regulator, OmpR family, contains REC and winged-helix (wHTH) domain [Sphingomonas laterariae]